MKRAFTRVAGKSATARDPKVKQLMATIEHLSAKNTLLENENDGLKQALAQEKQKRKRAKPLNSYLREEDDQAAVIFTPQKIKNAKAAITAEEEKRAAEEARKKDEKLQKQVAADIKATNASAAKGSKGKGKATCKDSLIQPPEQLEPTKHVHWEDTTTPATPRTSRKKSQKPSLLVEHDSYLIGASSSRWPKRANRCIPRWLDDYKIEKL